MTRFIGNSLMLGFGRDDASSVLMTPAERARHLYVCGATRTGKSKLLEDCIRQDILAWPRSGCGMLVLDRHGALVDNVMKFAAARDLQSWPIVPIDLRRTDWVVAYNPLRRRGRGEEESVVVGNFVRSIIHTWGQSDSNATPRLAKWLEAILFVLHTNNYTLAEALQLIVSPQVRREMTGQLEDVVARSIWETAPVKEAEFQEVLESTVNRVRKFLSRRVMRATLGQSHVSLDLGEALEEGQIILAAIATEGQKIDEEDASTFGSLLLSDLWMAAKARGKRDEGGVKPFYVYLDEFQEYVTPSMAETLDQASGFGLHMTLAHQFPSQLRKSDQGEQLYNSVMANCRSKVVFQTEHNEDLEELTLMLYRQMVDTRKVKQAIWSTKVLGHELRYMNSYSNGTNWSTGGGTSRSKTTGDSLTTGTSWSHSDGENESFAETDGTSESTTITETQSDSETDGTSSSFSEDGGLSLGESDSAGTNWGKSRGYSSGESTTDATSFGSAEGRSDGQASSRGTSRSQSIAFGKPTAALQNELGQFWQGELADQRAEDKFKRDQGQSIAMTHGESDGTSSSSGTSLVRSSGGSRSLARSRASSQNDSEGGSGNRGTSRSVSRSQGASLGATASRTHGTSTAIGQTLGTNHSESHTLGTSSSDTYGGSESRGVSSAKTRGRNKSWSAGTSQGVTTSPMLFPIYGKELSSVTFETVIEQLFRFAQYLAGQPDRHCVVKLVSKAPVAAVTVTVTPARTTGEWAAEWATMTVSLLRMALPMDDALFRIAERHRSIVNGLLDGRGEPSTTRIPVSVKPPRGGEGEGSPKNGMRRV
jgi:hypothetical protein